MISFVGCQDGVPPKEYLNLKESAAFLRIHRYLCHDGVPSGGVIMGSPEGSQKPMAAKKGVRHSGQRFEAPLPR